MADGRKYFVLCADNCKFEGMTKEQILTAITQAIQNGEINDVDTGFVTTLKEQNKGAGLSVWIGKQAEYNELSAKMENCLYIITDETTSEDLLAYIHEVGEKADNALIAASKWLESETEKGCFFRSVSGDDLGLSVEWLNPPLRFGSSNTLEIFRTAERRGKAPVYCYTLYASFDNPSGTQLIVPNGHIGHGSTYCECLEASMDINGETVVMPYIKGSTVYASSPRIEKDSNDDVHGVSLNFPNEINGTVTVQIIVKFTTY